MSTTSRHLAGGWVVALTATCAALPAAAQDSGHLFDRRPQAWQRQDQPILSARTTRQSWCQVVCYSPHVIHHDGKFRMWYLGTSEASRSNDIVMGYAESGDGLRWTEHPANPILSGRDVPWGRIIQTPFVLYDGRQQQFKMWFVSGRGVRRDEQGRVVENDQQLGYATSDDGLQWRVHPRPLYPSGRSPSVIQEGPRRYRMWMGSRPDEDGAWDDIYRHIYEFTSQDGLQWTRGAEPVIRAGGPARSTVYPFVVREAGRYFMWYGCHLEGGKFELFCATSADGSRWRVNHEAAAFPAAAGRQRFDSRYTSTPCLVRAADRWLLYYSARDWQTEYVDPQGRTRRDGAGVYAHIGVAEMAR